MRIGRSGAIPVPGGFANALIPVVIEALALAWVGVLMGLWAMPGWARKAIRGEAKADDRRDDCGVAGGDRSFSI